MEKKYQIFISSTYEDLKEERKKVMYAILEENQIPAGMELFSAADEEQWEIIKENINSSDYYVLILGFRYGSVFEDGENAGISYTEREYDYAVSQGVPVFAFILREETLDESRMQDTDSIKIDKLEKFKDKVKKRRTVKFWGNADELAKELIQSLHKAFMRGNRPGWVRTTEFNVDETLAEILELTQRVHTLEAINADLQMEISRKPDLWIEMRPITFEDGTENLDNMKISENHGYFHVTPVYMADVGDKIKYADVLGKALFADKDEVRSLRYIFKNAFPIGLYIRNDGDGRATGVSINIIFPKELFLISARELNAYYNQQIMSYSEDNIKNWDARFYAPEGCEVNDKDAEKEKFIPFEKLSSVPDVADLLDPAECDHGRMIFPGRMSLNLEGVSHKDNKFFTDVYILPTAAGQYTIKCQIYCNELPDMLEQDILIDVT